MAKTPHPRVVFFNGHNVPYEHARVHALSTAFKYAATVFKGLRAYHDEESGQLYLFRVAEHLERLAHSAAISRIPLPEGL